jgi:hypothetical protein
MLNGIPAIVTNRGGPPEMIGKGGIAVSLPKELHKAPYKRLLPPEILETVLQSIIRVYDDETGYQAMVRAAATAGAALHDINRNADRLVAQLATVLPDTVQSGYRAAIP